MSPIPKPPLRCSSCGAYDSWEETPSMIRREWMPGMVDYEDRWTCGICYRVYRVPMPVSVSLLDATKSTWKERK